VDNAKIDIISKLPPPMTTKGVRSFLGHAGFYRRFIKDFSKISRPLYALLSKHTKLMCDASDFALGAVLGQRINKVPHAIYYASKTLNDAQLNYSTTKKELLVVIFALGKFRSYLIGSKVIVFTDHAAAKPRLIRWVLLL
jgi:hypothetical protein